MQTKQKRLLLFFLLFCSVAFIFIPLAKCANIISDGWESGNESAWTGSDGTSTASTTRVYDGTYALKCTIASGSNNQWAGDYYLVSGNSTVCIGAWVYFEDAPNTSGEDQFCFFAGDDSGGNALAYAGITNDAGTLKWCVWAIESGTTLTKTLGSNYGGADWYFIEMDVYRGNGNGYVKLYVNDNLDIERTNIDNDGRNMDYARVGFSYSDAMSAQASDLYIDDAVISTSYIGLAENSSFTLSESINISELNSKAISASKTLTENSIIDYSSLKAIQIYKNNLEIINPLDYIEISKTLTKTLTESLMQNVNINDFLINLKGLTQVLSENINSIATFLNNIGLTKILNETLQGLESLTKQITLTFQLLENSLIQDYLNKQLSLTFNLQEISNLLDSLTKQANLNFDLSAIVNAEITQGLTKTLTQTLAETFNMIDACLKQITSIVNHIEAVGIGNADITDLLTRSITLTIVQAETTIINAISTLPLILDEASGVAALFLIMALASVGLIMIYKKR